MIRPTLKEPSSSPNIIRAPNPISRHKFSLLDIHIKKIILIDWHPSFLFLCLDLLFCQPESFYTAGQIRFSLGICEYGVFFGNELLVGIFDGGAVVEGKGDVLFWFLRRGSGLGTGGGGGGGEGDAVLFEGFTFRYLSSHMLVIVIP